MTKRPAIRASDIKATLAALKQAGLSLTTLEIRPDGTCSYYFKTPAQEEQAELDRELAEFVAKHENDPPHVSRRISRKRSS